MLQTELSDSFETMKLQEVEKEVNEGKYHKGLACTRQFIGEKNKKKIVFYSRNTQKICL